MINFIFILLIFLYLYLQNSKQILWLTNSKMKHIVYNSVVMYAFPYLVTCAPKSVK